MNKTAEYIIKQTLVFRRYPDSGDPVVDELRVRGLDQRRLMDDKQLLLRHLAEMDKSNNREQLAQTLAAKARPIKPWVLSGAVLGGGLGGLGGALSGPNRLTRGLIGGGLGAGLGAGLGWLGGKGQQGVTAENILDAHTERLLSKKPLA
jgi:hypothetical protein